MICKISNLSFEGNKFCFVYESELLGNYSDTLVDVLSDKYGADNVSIKKKTDSTYEIKIPDSAVDVLSIFSTDPSDLGLDDLINTLTDFESQALDLKLNSYEFIPLKGYSTRSIVKDVKLAVKSKSPICVVDTYDNYNKYLKGELFDLNYCNFDYLSDDYCDVVCYCLSKDIKGLSEFVKNKLTTKEWC